MQELLKICNQTERNVMGIMSGTSLDGIDIVFTTIQGTGNQLSLQVHNFKTYPISSQWRKRIQNSFTADAEEICRINFDLGDLFSETLLQFCEEHQISLKEIDLIGCHGQTINHVHGHSSLQLGEADIIAQKSNTLVVADFRTADIAAGGTGAPLVSYLDQLFFRSINENIALHNLGGISNVTFLPKEKETPLIAFDTGPANCALNELVEILSHGQEFYDRDGQWSSQGECNPDLLKELLEHDYFKRPLPKTTGREDFGKNYVKGLIEKHPQISLVDLLRTSLSLVSHSIAQAYTRYLPSVDKIIVSGGGANHPLLVQEIKELLPTIRIETFKEFMGITSDSKEAVAFAVLAHERINGGKTNVPSVTGATKSVSLGKISFPS